MVQQPEFTPRRGSVSSHYEPPKGEPERRKPYGFVLTFLFVASIPAAFICGGVTCYSVGVLGETAGSEMGWIVGIPIALAVTVGLIIASTLFFRKRTP